MAKAAAPYLHPSLQAVEHSAKDEQAYPRSIKVVFVNSSSDSEQIKIRPETVSKLFRPSVWASAIPSIPIGIISA